MASSVAAPVPEVPGIDLSYRPRTYFGPLALETHLLSHVAGQERREALRRQLAAGDLDLPLELVACLLDQEDREAIGRIHPAFMGGEYLPPLEDGETEIARISLASVTADQISVRARRVREGVTYRIVDEYSTDYSQSHRRPGDSGEPLTLAELVALIDGAGDEGGVVLRHAIASGADFVRVTSEFYPQLGHYYACRIDQWFEVNHPAAKTADGPDGCPDIDQSKHVLGQEEGTERATVQDRKNLNAFVEDLNNGVAFEDMDVELKSWWMNRY
jgi:hypothetical protein